MTTDRRPDASDGFALQIDAGVAAARRGDWQTVDAWLTAGGNPNQYDRAGWTPLLAAAVRGHAEVVRALLAADLSADPALPFLPTGALPIHFAGQSGSVSVVEQLLAVQPGHLENIWLLNGHTLLLQAVFFGHAPLVRWALERGANTAATTVRGLAAFELAAQFHQSELMALIKPFDCTAEAKDWHHSLLLGRIVAQVPYAERTAQAAQDDLIATIERALRAAMLDPSTANVSLKAVQSCLSSPGQDVNRLGGALQQPPLVVTVTGTGAFPLRRAIARELLDRGADPTIVEKHPMAVNAIIRAAVFGHTDILRDVHQRIGMAAMASALNFQPRVNGLTALHDTVLRASTADGPNFDRYLDQVRWFVAVGARNDIEDYAGRSQLALAYAVQDPVRRDQLVAEILGFAAASHDDTLSNSSL